MRIVEFECLVCGEIQEVWLDRLDSEPTEHCQSCNAPAATLRRCVYHPKHKHHMSWSKWRV